MFTDEQKKKYYKNDSDQKNSLVSPGFRRNDSSYCPDEPHLSVCVQVLQQEEQADKDWALSEAAAPGGPRPRGLKQRWREAVREAADGSLPQRAEFTAGQLDGYLDRLRARVVEDLGAAKRNVVSIYPEEYRAFQVRPRRLPGSCEGSVHLMI